MNRGLRLLGISGAVLTLVLVAVDLRSHAVASASVGIGKEVVPPGFRQRMRGLGWTEISFKGHVEMEAENHYPQADGSTLTVPSFKIIGSDPVPQGEGMRLIDADIRALDDGTGRNARSPFSVVSPSAWIPLVQDQDRFAFDMKRLWQLEDPVFEMPDFHQGRSLRIETAHADLDPETDQIFGRGPFLLVSGDLRLEGSDIFFDPATSRVEFQPLDGVLSWSIRNHEGAIFRGSCDGPGAFYPGTDDSYRLEFHAVEEVRTFFPSDSVMPGILITRDMTLHLLPAEGDRWHPSRAHAKGPTHWQGETLQIQGADSSVAWKDDGTLDHLTVRGPVEVRPQDESFEVATADGFARFHPASEMVRLEDSVTARHARGTINGEWAELSPARWQVGGSVMALGDDGLALGDLLTTDRQGNWTLRGHAEIFPHGSSVDWVRSPEIHFDEQGRVYTDAGFTLHATVNGDPLLAAGDHLDSRLERGRSSSDPKVRRTRAEGNLSVEHQGRQLRGEKLQQTGDASFRLTGDPTTGKRVTGHALVGETLISLDCGRLVWNGTEVALDDAPRLEIPASSLGLAGEVVVIGARQILQHAEEGWWELRDEVKFSGALVGGGDRATWTPGVGVSLLVEGLEAQAMVKGHLQDGREFQVEGVHIRYSEEGRLAVSDGAHLSLLQPGEDVPTQLWGDEIELGETSGWAVGAARFHTADVRGSARRIDWTRYPGHGDLLILVDDAELASGTILASGPHLEVDTRVDTITGIGTDELPAKLRAEDGRTAVGDWLRYHPGSGRFESRGARFETP